MSGLRERIEDSTGITWSLIRDSERLLPRGRFVIRHNSRLPRLKLEWNLWSSFCHAEFRCGPCGDDRAFTVGLALPPVSLWFTVGGWEPYTTALWKKLGLYQTSEEHPPYGHYEDREIRVAIFNSTLWWNLWTNPDMGRCNWRENNVSINPVRWLLGAMEHSRIPLRTERVTVDMPEGSHTGSATLYADTWKRPRSPFRELVHIVDITMDDGQEVPVPGKGTTEYNCGDDAIGISSHRADSIDAAVRLFVADTLATRERYGGRGWRPTPADTCIRQVPCRDPAYTGD